MAINPEFQFSQSSLQDYIDCSRRFELRYIERLRWPALQSEPVLEQEQHMLQGHRFHKMAHQYILKIPGDYKMQAAGDGNLLNWWDNFIQNDPLSKLPKRRFPEYTLSAQLAEYRITAKYDLLAVDPENCAVIVDWKTGHRSKPNRLKERMQTRLYPYLLVEAGTNLNCGSPIQPDQVQMIYWFASDPENAIIYNYDQVTYLADQAFLSELIAEISARQPGRFLLAEDEKACLFCVYRSLCGRGAKAGDWNLMEDDFDQDLSPSLDLDFDQIGEIAF